MKNILKYGFLGLGIVAMTSCIDTMDTHPTTVFDAETVWGSKATVEGFVYSTYTEPLKRILPQCISTLREYSYSLLLQ